MAQSLLDALGHAIDIIDSLAKMDVNATATWYRHVQPDIHVNMMPCPKNHTAHQKMAYAAAKEGIHLAMHRLSQPMEDMPSVGRTSFIWTIESHQSRGVYKTRLICNGVPLATGNATSLGKVISNFVAFLSKLPPHNNRTYLVGGVRLPAGDDEAALALWAALQQKGAPTPEGTRTLLTGPKRPEILRAVDVTSDLIDSVTNTL